MVKEKTPMSEIASTVDPRVLKDDELDAVAGGETTTSSFPTVSHVLQAKYDSARNSILSTR
jgi:hypothetical protein